MTKKYENHSNFQQSRPEITEEKISWQPGLYLSGKGSLETQGVLLTTLSPLKHPIFKKKIFKINGQKILG